MEQRVETIVGGLPAYERGAAARAIVLLAVMQDVP
jgi:hypothetical protein